ncbi:hypothetical protein ABMC89_05600 [Sulfitobacter sp. HNIBRBA3233]|uniref:hypothetical protein n=1 Tax=Sulfitobacter marinivivus TaxID=3158558 RepID=UPI0032E039ED
MKSWLILATATVLLAGCTSDDDRIAFDGQFYNAKLRKVERQLDTFTVTVRPVSRSLAGALEAGEYAAIEYCVNTFGSSDIIWAVGPETPQQSLPIESDTLTLQGQCPGAR